MVEGVNDGLACITELTQLYNGLNSSNPMTSLQCKYPSCKPRSATSIIKFVIPGFLNPADPALSSSACQLVSWPGPEFVSMYCLCNLFQSLMHLANLAVEY